MMALLVTGLTDEDAAARLGVSRWTLRRRLKAVMTKLDAHSRLEAGYRLGRAGWVPEED